MNIVSEITNFSKLPTYLILIIALISSLLLFANNDFLIKLALIDFKNEYNTYIGIVFLFTISISFINIIKLCFSGLKYLFIQYKKYTEKREQKNEIKNLLNNLDENEKTIIREFKIQQKKAITASLEDPSVLNLIETGILEQIGTTVSQTSITGITIDIKVSKIANKFISDNLIDYPNNQQRPMWIERINTQEAVQKRLLDTISWANK